jgi:hypothetical protein
MIGLFHLVLAKPGLQRRRQIKPPKARVSYIGRRYWAIRVRPVADATRSLSSCRSPILESSKTQNNHDYVDQKTPNSESSHEAGRLSTPQPAVQGHNFLRHAYTPS